MKLDPVRRVKLYEQVVSIFKAKAETGELKPGDRIPPERDLVGQLGVSRAVLREALRVMEVKGVLETVRGEGRIYAGTTMLDLERITDQVRNSAVLEILDARQGIECRTAELAAERADKQAIKRLWSLVPAEDAPCGNARSNFETNRKFHLQIAASAQNAVLYEVLGMLLNLRSEVHRTDLLDEAMYRATFREHAVLVEAIEKRDQELARNLMRKHIEHTKDVIRKADLED